MDSNPQSKSAKPLQQPLETQSAGLPDPQLRALETAKELEQKLLDAAQQRDEAMREKGI